MADGLSLDSQGRVPLGAPAKLPDGRDGTVVRRGPLKDATVLKEKNGKNHFQAVKLYTVTVKADDGDVVRLPRVTAEQGAT